MIFLREATQNDHIRLLYKFEKDKKKFGCVGSCGYAPASVKIVPLFWITVLPGVPLMTRKTKQWQNIGFQGDDPKTDFRGMGLLGLKNLL